MHDDSGNISISTNGEEWNKYKIDTRVSGDYTESMYSAGNKFFIAGTDSSDNCILFISDNGTVWKKLHFDEYVLGAGYIGNVYIVFTYNKIYASRDCENWEENYTLSSTLNANSFAIKNTIDKFIIIEPSKKKVIYSS